MKKVLKNRFLWIIVLVSVITIISAIYYGGEYRVSGLKLLKTGVIEIQLDDTNINIFIDDKNVGFSTEENQTIIFNKIKPGTHTVLVAKNKSWPWSKEIQVKEGEVIKMHPFVLPIKDLDVFLLDKKGEDYLEVDKQISTLRASSKIKEAYSTDLSTKVWVDGNKILGMKIDNPEEKFLIFESLENSIKNVGFYKDRNDVLLFASGGFIYVIETHRKGGQNFQPLIQGTDPIFINKDFESIYVLDEEEILQIKL